MSLSHTLVTFGGNPMGDLPGLLLGGSPAHYLRAWQISPSPDPRLARRALWQISPAPTWHEGHGRHAASNKLPRALPGVRAPCQLQPWDALHSMGSEGAGMRLLGGPTVKGQGQLQPGDACAERRSGSSIGSAKFGSFASSHATAGPTKHDLSMSDDLGRGCEQ